jgi:hypothetical protein
MVIEDNLLVNQMVMIQNHAPATNIKRSVSGTSVTVHTGATGER